MKRGVYCIALLLIGALPSRVPAAPINLSDIAKEGLTGWNEHRFKGQTQYRVVTLNGIPLISARSHGTASGLYKKIRIDLDATPYLNWQWQIEKPLPVMNEQSKAGDDYSARVYVILEGGLMPWRTKALNYVWSSSQPTGSSWPNAFSGQSRMIALRSPMDKPNVLVSERRDIKADFLRYFGATVHYIDVIAIMTDTDNSGQQAHAYYGDLFFSR
ncbi:DUF3047 domain-containing protein [Sedimenticola sp.]|uniref:DUF3047 domain-containing protein n=1 Tax=Sedimenticola sp. TaxID=1940285 RepID=UPI003D1371B4